MDLTPLSTEDIEAIRSAVHENKVFGTSPVSYRRALENIRDLQGRKMLKKKAKVLSK